MELKIGTVYEILAYKDKFRECWKKLDKRSESKELDLDVEMCKVLHDNHMLHILYLEDDGKVRGFFMFTVSPSLLLKGKKDLVSFFIWLDYEYRCKFKEIVRLIEGYAKKLGVDSICYQLKTNKSRSLEPEYYLSDYVYIREVG